MGRKDAESRRRTFPLSISAWMRKLVLPGYLLFYLELVLLTLPGALSSEDESNRNIPVYWNSSSDIKPVNQSVSQSASQLVNQLIRQSAVQPVSYPASQSVSQSASQSAMQPVSYPVSQSASQSISQSASQSVSLAASELSSQSVSQSLRMCLHRFARCFGIAPCTVMLYLTLPTAIIACL
ncbi:DNA methylase n-4/n-6 domain protein [Plakobranchus ocellatus]|uniref:DNA methylase n-4/n-6 domain protein n=1 Tax=Plakobranchus ocellatus TaxID=259542 RepID=A0AAV4D636_9GAST|nr:DNA methylase n-4/n-6 domain protein [Plakobranchus ocellatus]